ncbi:MAG: pyridoxamine 5'-phosphate oxidase family protein [Chloroflexota bacterium]
MPEPDQMVAVRERMQQERTVWMATTRPDGRPHVAPIWFVWHVDRAYIMTGGVKLANVRHNGLAALNTEDGDNVVIVEGTARIIPADDPLFQAVAQRFMEIYDWDISTSVGEQQLIEIAPVKTLAWKA